MGQARVSRRSALGLGAAALLTSALPARAASSVAERLRLLGGRAPRPLQLLLPNGSQDNLAPVIAAFTQASGCEVRMRPVPFDDVATVLTLDSLSDLHAVDVALPPTFAMADLVEAGAIVPLGDFAAAHEDGAMAAGMLYDKGNHFDGRRFGYQTDGDVYMLFLNGTLMEDPVLKAGYEDTHGAALDVPATWAELDRQMAWFHRPGQGTVGGALFRGGGRVPWEWWLRVHAKGIWPLGPEFEIQFDGPEGLAALEELLAVTPLQIEPADVLGERYGQGDVYANLGWGGTQKQLRRNSVLRDRLVFGPPPGGVLDGRALPLPYFNWGWSYVVAEGSPMPELAYLFCLMAVEPALSTEAVRRDQGFFDPFRVEHYDDPAIREVYSAPFLDVHRRTLSEAIPDFYLPGRTRYFNRLGTWLERAVRGTVAPAAALDEAARDWRTIAEEEGPARQARHWQAIRALYPEALRRSLRDTG